MTEKKYTHKSVEVRLRKKVEALEWAQKISGFGTWSYDINEQRLHFSEAALQVLRHSFQSSIDMMGFSGSIAPEYQRHMQVYWKELRQTGELSEIIFPMRTRGSAIHWYKIIGSAEIDTRGSKASTITGVISDVSAEQASHRQLRLLTGVVDQSANALAITDPEGLIIYVNPAYVKMTGFSMGEALGQRASLLKSGLTPLVTYQKMWKCILSGKTWRGELNNRRKSGDFFWAYTSISPLRDEQGRVTHYLSVQEDISVRKQQEEKLLYQAHHDSLTNLPNRLLAFDRLTVSLKYARRMGHQLSLMFIDLDHFKQVNDSLGHDAGDQLLVKVARRLESTLRDGDTVARLGGDEFLVVLESGNAKVAELTSKRIKLTLATPMSIAGRELVTTASIGMTQYPADGETPETLMRNADAAMYEAKSVGRNTFRFFTQAMNVESQRRLEVESELRRALSRDEIYVLYQPIVDTKTCRIVGAEALARWKNERLGEVSPVDFIPLAEELGLIVDIGDWIIQQASGQCKQWQTLTGDKLFIAINISPRQLRDNLLKQSLKSALLQHQLSSDSLVLEVTEGVLIDNIEAVLVYLNDLTASGMQLAIDDFGTGYSSLSYLKSFPFTRLKIDRTFINDSLINDEGQILVKVMTGLAHNFGMSVVAEGVETQAQHEFLKEIGADHFQGYFFSRPLPAEAMRALLSSSAVVQSVAVDVRPPDGGK